MVFLFFICIQICGQYPSCACVKSLIRVLFPSFLSVGNTFRMSQVYIQSYICTSIYIYILYCSYVRIYSYTVYYKWFRFIQVHDYIVHTHTHTALCRSQSVSSPICVYICTMNKLDRKEGRLCAASTDGSINIIDETMKKIQMNRTICIYYNIYTIHMNENW